VLYLQLSNIKDKSVFLLFMLQMYRLFRQKTDIILNESLCHM